MKTTKRRELHEFLPLNTPFSVHIYPTSLCNFKCNYCVHSLDDKDIISKKLSKGNMDFELYKKAVDEIGRFPQKLKSLIFAGHGEPLLHPQIADMVSYAKNMNIAERVEIVTNGSLLTKKMADDLINSGVDRLRISLQGVRSDKYKQVANVNIDIDDFKSNLKYFFEKKKNTEVYIKIIDVALEGDDKKIFYEDFNGIADQLAIEYAIPFVKEIPKDTYHKDFLSSKQGNKVSDTAICSMPFYMLVLANDGNILPCCAIDYPISFGNIKDISLNEVWHSNERNDFLMLQLKDRNINKICQECSVPSYGLQTGDYLDDYRVALINKFSRNEVKI